MIEKLFSLRGVDVYVAPFLPEEIASGQIAAQKSAVGRLAGFTLGDGVSLSHRADGSPMADGVGREISVSHCAGMAAMAVGADKRIGVDIETPRATLRRVARKFLSEQELKAWTSDADLLRAWTIKEALYKAAGRQGVDFANEVVLPEKSSSTGAVVMANGAVARFELKSAAYGGGCVTLAVPIDQSTRQ